MVIQGAKLELTDLPLFDGLSAEIREWLGARARSEHFEDGQEVVSEGDMGDRLYVIAAGRAAVVGHVGPGEEAPLAVLGRLDVFGESGVLRSRPRATTVRAAGPLEVWSFGRDDIADLWKRDAQAAADLTERLSQWVIERQLHRASPFAPLARHVLRRAVAALSHLEVPAGTPLLREGEVARDFYLIRSGRCDVLQGGRRIQVMGEGDYFGEAGLMTGEASKVTIVAHEPATLLVLDREVFRELVATSDTLEEQMVEMVRLRHGTELEARRQLDPRTAEISRRRRLTWIIPAAGLALFGIVSAASEIARSPGLVYAAVTLGALVGPMSYVTFVAESDILRRRARWIAATFLLGALASAPATWAIEGLVRGLAPTPVTSAGFAVLEELAKLLPVVLVLRRGSSRFAMDGIVFGAAAGMGFAATETALYGLVGAGHETWLLQTLWARTLLVPFGHGTWTAIVCAAIWTGRSGPRRRLDPLLPGAFLLAVILHTLWDIPGLPDGLEPIWLLAVGVVGLAVLWLFAGTAHRDELAAVLRLNPHLRQAGDVAGGVHCARCGEPSVSGARYCPRCGAALPVD